MAIYSIRPNRVRRIFDQYGFEIQTHRRFSAIPYSLPCLKQRATHRHTVRPMLCCEYQNLSSFNLGKEWINGPTVYCYGDLIGASKSSNASSDVDSLDILSQQFARGGIDPDKYEQRKKILEDDL